jgi:hypothetical protein
VLFLLPIPVALLLAIAWVSWVSRPPRLPEAIDSVEEYRRALQRLAPRA